MDFAEYWSSLPPAGDPIWDHHPSDAGGPGVLAVGEELRPGAGDDEAGVGLGDQATALRRDVVPRAGVDGLLGVVVDRPVVADLGADEPALDHLVERGGVEQG